MELIISVLSLFIGKGGEGGGGFRGITAFFRRNGGGGISLRQQSIKRRLEKVDCQRAGGGSVNDERSLERNRRPRM